MEFRVFPAGFNIVPLELSQPDGSKVQAVQVTILDVSQQPVHFTFAGADWELFQRAVADPVGEAERQQARSRIVAPSGMAPSVGRRPPRTNPPEIRR